MVTICFHSSEADIYEMTGCMSNYISTRGFPSAFHCFAILPFFSPQVPPLFLKQLTADKQIFKELPAK